jgi:hypothetical protein
MIGRASSDAEQHLPFHAALHKEKIARTCRFANAAWLLRTTRPILEPGQASGVEAGPPRH